MSNQNSIIIIIEVVLMENEKVHIFITKEELSDEQLKGAKGTV